MNFFSTAKNSITQKTLIPKNEKLPLTHTYTRNSSPKDLKQKRNSVLIDIDNSYQYKTYDNGTNAKSSRARPILNLSNFQLSNVKDYSTSRKNSNEYIDMHALNNTHLYNKTQLSKNQINPDELKPRKSIRLNLDFKQALKRRYEQSEDKSFQSGINNDLKIKTSKIKLKPQNNQKIIDEEAKINTVPPDVSKYKVAVNQLKQSPRLDRNYFAVKSGRDDTTKVEKSKNWSSSIHENHSFTRRGQHKSISSRAINSSTSAMTVLM